MLEVVIEVPPDLELIGGYLYNFVVLGIRAGRRDRERLGPMAISWGIILIFL